MTDLRAFIEARLTEDEALARDALHPDAVTPGEWMTEHHNAESNTEPDCCHIAEDRSGNYWSVAREVFIPNAEHMARHDPARVLREVAAKRALLAEYEAAFRRRKQHREDLANAGALLTMVLVVKLLAAVWSDHPDYLAEWSSPDPVVPII